MFIIENITDIFLPIWTLWVRCAAWLIQANPIRSVWLILRVLSKKNCGKFKFFCGILNLTILAFRMYAATMTCDMWWWMISVGWYTLYKEDIVHITPTLSDLTLWLILSIAPTMVPIVLTSLWKEFQTTWTELRLISFFARSHSGWNGYLPNYMIYFTDSQN